MKNPLTSYGIEYHILQSFPVTCLNRDDVGAPKSAIVGGVQRARVSSQCWKRHVRLQLRDLGVHIGIRTKKLEGLLLEKMLKAGAAEEQAKVCSSVMASTLATDTLLFIADSEIDNLVAYAAEKQFSLPLEAKGNLPKKEASAVVKCLQPNNKFADGLDIALFGRMVAQAPEVNVRAAASFAHAISTHKSVNEVEFFTALDDIPGPDVQGSAHMGALEYNSATYYRYIALDLGQLWDSIGGENIQTAVQAFTKALYLAVPGARQSTQAGSCLWNYARILVRKGQRMQVCFDNPVRSEGSGWLIPSIKALDAALENNESLSGSLYGKVADYTFGKDPSFNIDALCTGLSETLGQLGNEK